MTDILFLFGILLIAVLYSSVGHGGASGYLAFMAVLSIDPLIMRPAALTLNIFVSGIAFFSYARNKHFRFELFWPFIVTSLPMAFLGGLISVNAHVYKIILSIFLLFAVFRMLIQIKKPKEKISNINISLALIIGLLIGFFSGLIGIGGGIILSPIILLLNWANAKETAAVSAAFILVNSIAGMSGFLIQNSYPHFEIIYMIIAAVVGGMLGSHIGSRRIKEVNLRYALAVVLLLASFKLMLT